MVNGFLGQFAVGPGIHRPVEIRWWGAGQVDNLDNLFSGEGIGRARAWCVSEDGSDGGAQVGLIAFHRREGRLGGRPASTPEADGRG